MNKLLIIKISFSKKIKENFQILLSQLFIFIEKTDLHGYVELCDLYKEIQKYDIFLFLLDLKLHCI